MQWNKLIGVLYSSEHVYVYILTVSEIYQRFVNLTVERETQKEPGQRVVVQLMG